LADEESEVEDCRFYGVPGDDQEGIDIFARLSDGRYRVYQCKRVQNLQPHDISEAVDEFIKGQWVPRAKEFFLCFTDSLSTRKRVDTFRDQQERLSKQGLRLSAWDADQLNQMLKKHPAIVDDFFGRPWAVGFCGQEEATRLGERLDGGRLARLRQGLGRLYLTIFRRDDQSFGFRDPAKSATQALVLPDIIASEEVAPARAATFPAGAGSSSSAPTAGDGDAETDAASASEAGFEEREQRSDLMEYLAREDVTVLVGDPGAGKSTILRTIALDLLASDSQMEPLARRWAGYLPLWISFARWTSILAGNGSAAQVSLPDAVDEWLSLHGGHDLVPLVQSALRERRVILLVDGIDEWQSEQSARNALALLEVFASDREAPLIATSRPRALELLGLPVGWRVGCVAPLSPSQQATLAAQTLRREVSLEPEAVDESLLSERTAAFLRAIDQRSDLGEIARTPLLLTVIAQLWHRDERLPDNQFVAYGKLVEILVLTHPRRRITAARIERPLMPVDVMRKALAALAYSIISDHPSGLIDRKDAARVLTVHFCDDECGEGLTAAEARRATNDLMEHATDRAGILVARSTREVGFYHRALMEYLAAEAIAARDPDFQLSLVERRARDPQWHEVIVALAAVTPSRAHVKAMIDRIRGQSSTPLERLLKLPLLASIVFSSNACSPKTAREIAKDVLDEVELGTSVAIRERLLEQALRGLNTASTGTLVSSRIKRWLPRRPTYRGRLYEIISGWLPLEKDSEACLWRGLYDESIDDARAAGRALCRLIPQKEGIHSRLLALGKTSPMPRVRAVVLDALARTNVPVSRAERLAIAGDSPRAELQLAAIHSRIKAGEHTESDLDAMLALATWSPDLDYRWRADLDELLVCGWRSSARLRDSALAAVDENRTREDIDRDIGRAVLIRGFLSDDHVSRVLAGEFDTEYGPHGHDVWQLYAEFGRESDIIKSAIDSWLLSSKSKHRDVEAHWAALTTRSEQAKLRMIAKLNHGWPNWAARALLGGWGMQDPQVANALEDTLRGPVERARELAPQIAAIIPDREEARRILLTMIPNAGHRLGFVAIGLGQVRRVEPEPQLLSALLEESQKADDFFAEVRSTLFEHWTDDERVVQLARRQLENPDEGSDLALVALAARTRPELRPMITDLVGVLPARLRFRVTKRLETSRVDSNAAAALRAFTHEPNAAVRTQSALAYCAQAKTPRGFVEGVLRKEITRTGSQIDAARPAALASLLRLGKLDEFVNATEHDGRPANLRTGRLSEQNSPFWKEVADHWHSLKAALGESLFPRLMGSDAGAPEDWDLLATVAAQSRVLANDVLAFAVDADSKMLGPNMLRFLAREWPRSARLRDILIECMRTQAQWWAFDTSDDRNVIATELLAESFSGDIDTLRLIAPATPSSGSPPVLPVVALASGWPRSQELERIYDYLATNDISFHPIGHGAVCAVKASPECVVRILADYDNYTDGLRRPDIRVVTRLLLRRLQDDDDVFDQAVAAQRTTSGASRIILLRLLAVARGLTDFRSDIEKMAEVELSGSVPSLVRNPFNGSLVPGAALLLEGLLGREF
jgi:hypothetical protein